MIHCLLYQSSQAFDDECASCLDERWGLEPAGRNFALQPFEQETHKLLSILLRIRFKICVLLDESIVEFLGIQALLCLRSVDFAH